MCGPVRLSYTDRRMLDRPSIVCRVLRPFVSLIVAHRDQLLIVWPGHPKLTVCVCSPDGATLLRSRYVPEGRLYGDLLHLFLDAKIHCLSETSERALLRTA